MDKQKIYFVERGDYEFSEVVYLSLDYEKAKNFAVKHYEEYQESIYGQIDSEITEEIDRIKSRLEELEEVISRYNAG